MDFIMKFSELRNLITNIKYDSILVVVNKFIKYAHLISYNKRFTVKQITWMVLDRVI